MLDDKRETDGFYAEELRRSKYGWRKHSAKDTPVVGGFGNTASPEKFNSRTAVNCRIKRKRRKRALASAQKARVAAGHDETGREMRKRR